MFSFDDFIMSSTVLHDGVVPIESRCVIKAKHVLTYWFVLIAVETSTHTGAVEQYFRRFSKAFAESKTYFSIHIQLQIDCIVRPFTQTEAQPGKIRYHPILFEQMTAKI